MNQSISLPFSLKELVLLSGGARTQKCMQIHDRPGSQPLVDFIALVQEFLPASLKELEMYGQPEVVISKLISARMAKHDISVRYKHHYYDFSRKVVFSYDGHEHSHHIRVPSEEKGKEFAEKLQHELSHLNIDSRNVKFDVLDLPMFVSAASIGTATQICLGSSYADDMSAVKERLKVSLADVGLSDLHSQYFDGRQLTYIKIAKACRSVESRLSEDGNRIKLADGREIILNDYPPKVAEIFRRIVSGE